MSEFKRIVECTQHREGGTHITFDACGRWPAGRYHFRPGLMRDARHADTITNEAHYERLLSLPEGFRPVHPDDLLNAPAVNAPAAKAPAAVPAAAPQGEQQPAGEGEAEDDGTADTWDASKVLALGVNRIIGMVKGFTDEQIRQLLDEEGRREDPRESLVKSLTGTLRNRAAP